MFRMFLILFFGMSLFSCSTTREERPPFDLDIGLDGINNDIEKRGSKQNFFKDKTVDYGLGSITAYNFNVVDINGDNYSDIVVIPSFYSEPEFYYFNVNQKKFIKGANPFNKTIKASFLLFYDLNKDDVLDVISGVLNQKTELSKDPLRVFHGKKSKQGQLSFIEKESFLNSSPNSSIGLIDYDLNGTLDLYVGNWFKRIKNSPYPAHDEFFVNNGKKFVKKTVLLEGESKQNLDQTMFINATPTYGVQVCDMDQDGYPDILTATTNSYQNKLWMNRFRFREEMRYFTNIAQSVGYAGDAEGLINSQGGGRTFGLACADYNNDGIMDVFLGELAHNYDNEGVDKSSILTGRSFRYPPSFYRTEYFRDTYDPNWHQADRRGIWADFNNDGLLDLLVDNSGYPPYTRMILFQQHSDHSFENMSSKYGIDIINPIGSVIADFNRDGKMDILTSQSNIRDESITPRIYLFENSMDLKKNRSIRFYLRGSLANYHGLGAMIIIKVRKEGKIETRRQSVSYSYGALSPQNEEGVQFGLNEGERLISVKVRWPFSDRLNTARNNLEKTYTIKTEFSDFINVTLCENGDYLLGRRTCL